MSHLQSSIKCESASIEWENGDDEAGNFPVPSGIWRWGTVSGINELPARVRAVAEARLAFSREYSGLHEFDGQIQDLSPEGVRKSLALLGGPPLCDPLDDATVAGAEASLRTRLGQLEMHRHDPFLHVEALDLTSYEREYAPLAERMEARSRHLALWPDAVDAAISSLDSVPAAVAAAFLGPVRGMASAITPADGDTGERATQALQRLVTHLEHFAQQPAATEGLGADRLITLLGCADGITVDLGQLLVRTAAEKLRMVELLREACAQIAPGEPIAEVVRTTLARHGTFADVLSSAQNLVDEAREFVRSHSIAPFADGDCIVEATPAARRWGVGRISWSGAWEPAAPARFHLTPPDPDWSPDAQDAWLRRFGRAALPALAVHETFPGHANHALAMRQVTSPTRRTLWSELFFEGWAHYCEEMCLEEGFQGGSPVLQAGVALEALVRLARIENAIGLHTHQITVEEGARLFSENAFLDGPAATVEARRGLFEPTYTRYGVGKFFFLDLREAARRQWGADFTLLRFHTEVLSLGSPPLAPVADALGLDPQLARWH
jgi:Bacterial protein of unknown function (DUF885)